MKKILDIFKRKKNPGAPLFKIDVKRGKDTPAFTITSPKPATKVAIPKERPQPAFTINSPVTIITPKEELHHLLPEHHLSDAEALSQIVAQQPKQVKKQPAAEKPATVDQVVAVLKKKVRAKRPEATLERQRKKASRKTKHDKVIEKIAKIPLKSKSKSKR